MSEQKIETILEHIKEALGEHQQYFDITEDEILVDDVDTFSMTVGVQPRKMKVEDSEVIGEKQLLQFDIHEDGNCILIVGEDTEWNITFGNIYCQLYWGAATKAV